MGLDMYLNRFHRYKNVSANQITIIESYFDWMTAKEEGSEYANCDFNQWCGHDESELPSEEIMNCFKQFYKKHCIGDYTYYIISEEVGYWRKCNAIHNWFVNHVQDGIDDCKYHHEVTKEILEKLYDDCLTVLEKSKLVSRKHKNVIKDKTVAKSILPTQDGFFFGSTDYDEWYIDGLKHTVDVIRDIIDTTNFETQMIYYHSSW